MKVKMKVSMSGPRSDGTDWPKAGAELEVSSQEGMDLCAGGLAVPVKESPVETAVLPEPETPEPPKKRGRPRKNPELVPGEDAQAD